MKHPSRKEVALPRGRPTSEELPAILPFPKQADPDAPRPVLEFHGYFVGGGMALHLTGERWRAEDMEGGRAIAYPDPMQPGIMLAAHLENGLDGSLIRAVSFEEFQERVREIREGYIRPLADTPRAR